MFFRTYTCIFNVPGAKDANKKRTGLAFKELSLRNKSQNTEDIMSGGFQSRIINFKMI